jgi:geranylgeranyl diphosphate synthase type I
MTAQAGAVHPVGAELAGIVRDFTNAPGKRIRPVLMHVAYEGFGGHDLSEVAHALCALELLHSFLLIHDDIMDRSDLRRGRPTVHREYSARYQGRVRDNAHFGQTMGILAGDVAGQQAILALSQSHSSPERTSRAVVHYAEMTMDVCYGQALDTVISERPLEDITEEEVLLVAEYKTARYTTELPLHLGAILAGAGEDDLKRLTAYAVPVGIAFQLRDDLLGVFGEQARLGKSTDSDLLEGKRTLLILRAWERADIAQQAIFRHVLGNPSATPAELNSARDVIDATGAKAATIQQMEELVDEAKESLTRTSFTPDVVRFLTDLADYVADRER